MALCVAFTIVGGILAFCGVEQRSAPVSLDKEQRSAPVSLDKDTSRAEAVRSLASLGTERDMRLTTIPHFCAIILIDFYAMFLVQASMNACELHRHL
jgi:hypothetical protein